MTKPHGAASDVAERDEQEFTVAIPGQVPEEPQVLPPGVPEQTQRLPVDEKPPRHVPPMPKPPAAAAPASRTTRFGAALFWMVMGWWLFTAVQVGAELVEATYVDGAVRRLPFSTVLDIVREATDHGRVELIAAAALPVLATVLLLVSRGRRRLGVAALLVAVGTTALAWWHLVP